MQMAHEIRSHIIIQKRYIKIFRDVSTQLFCSKDLCFERKKTYFFLRSPRQNNSGTYICIGMFPPRKRWQTTANVFFLRIPDPKAENVSVGHPDSKSQSEVILLDSTGTKICIYKHIYR